ncbi:hypothetical protein JHK84_033249 [Glycine max]|uniref:Maternal effect embryo arrest 60 n=2 Tax=Glycine subgen. Soja TaxID=1462606 RepID=A0A0R0HFA7_SOYBN|nr:uncharacterized protein LOC100808626 [Glycine max]XP_028195260.1 uncharacterized protein LOC114380415 [Glycine soja]KAG5139481.1 hypothetical protein JHK84_033249 [Glycine max]RZB74495.1 hypothetical protein D0Y65_033490 [Glycine soja]|eukprot:XP_025980345.1 uncharacterized protein LOC100808626 [Glycine max]
MLSSFGFVSSAYMSDSDVSRRKMTTTTRIHIMALDGIVNVNSLFTLALFLGITTTSTTNTLIGDDNAACAAGASISEGLIAFHVYSFSSFLFSSLIALALKNIINFSKDIKDGDVVLDNNNNNWVHSAAKINTVVLRLGTLVSAFGSVFGCGFLVMALVDLVQIKLGTLACGSPHTFAAVAPLLVLVPTALLIYVVLVLYSFTR